MKFNWNDRKDRERITGFTLVIWWAILLHIEQDLHWFWCLGSGLLGFLIIFMIYGLVTLVILSCYEYWIVRFFPKLDSRFPNLYAENAISISIPAGWVSNFYILINYSFGRTSFTLFENYTICLPTTFFG